MNSLSVCVLALNEEKKIGNALDSIKSFADEVIVCVDENTTDNTRSIAQKYTNHVHTVPHEKALEWQLERMFSFCTKDWILRIDADEIVSPELAEEIKKALHTPNCDAYAMPRKNIIFGKWIKHSIWYPDYQLRLIKKQKVKSLADIKLHQIIPVDGTVENFTQHLLHNNYESVEQYLEKMMRYTTIEASTQFQNKQKVLAQDFILKPSNEFIKGYIALEGFKDGLHGLALALLQAFYTFLVVVKLWEMNKYQPDKGLDVKELEEHMNEKLDEIKWWKHELQLKYSSDSIARMIIKIKRKIGK